jgi:hypothetical protein
MRTLPTTLRPIETGADPCVVFDRAIREITAAHVPTRMPFFAKLAAMPRFKAADPAFLGKLHLVYQAAMHATRVAVYHLPHLDNPAMRKKKVQIFVDDDGLPGGDTHHYQLTRAFKAIGAECVIDDEEFGSIDELRRHLDPKTARFARLAQTLYARSLGPWCVVEMLSVDWMRGLAEALSAHFPGFAREQYFAECFDNQVEERHAEESLEAIRAVLAARPRLLDETLRDARVMAEALDGVWARMEELVDEALAG